MAYATVSDVQERITRVLTDTEMQVCASLLDDAAVIIDSYNKNAEADAKKIVSCRMVIRALGTGSGASDVPIGATQGSMAALGYSQSWTVGGGTVGEIYLGKLEKKMLGVGGGSIGSYSPVEELAKQDGDLA